MTRPNLIEAAHDLAALGWAVFPLSPRDKKPYPFSRGLLDASADVGRVVEWWSGREPIPMKDPAARGGRSLYATPDANIGMATGSPSGVLVLDVDGDEGVASLRRLIADFAMLPQTVRQNTGKGGHLLFAWPDGWPIRNKAGNIGQRPDGERPYPGLDIRADGGYIVCAPSVHPTGRVYQWAQGCSPFERPLAHAPLWFLRLICPPPAPPAKRPARISADAGSAYVRVALQAASDAVAGAWPGTQNATLHNRAFSMGRLVAGGILDSETAREALIRAGCAMSSGNPRDPWTRQSVAKAVDHAFKRAEGHPNYGPKGKA